MSPHSLRRPKPTHEVITAIRTNDVVAWTREMHKHRHSKPCGDFVLTDRHHEFVRDLGKIFSFQPVAVSRLEVP